MVELAEHLNVDDHFDAFHSFLVVLCHLFIPDFPFVDPRFVQYCDAATFGHYQFAVVTIVVIPFFNSIFKLN